VSVAPSPTAPAPEPGIHGHCAPPALAELIRDLYLDERTGVLVISRSGAEKRIMLDRGMILLVSSSLSDERLPACLVQAGLMNADEAEALKGLDDRQVLDILKQRGQIPLPRLQQAVRALAQQVLTALFRWESIEYRFEETAVSPGLLETNVVVSFELIIRALRSMAGFEPIKEALLRQDRSLQFSDQLYLPFDQLRLSPVEGFLVSRVDGQTKVRDILAQIPPADEVAASRFLFGLLILGLVHFVPPIGSGPLSCEDLLRGEEEKRAREERERATILGFYKLVHEQTPGEILGVGDEATTTEVKAAYQERKERFAASRFLKKVQNELKEELQIIEARLLEAFLAVGSSRLDAARPAAGAVGDRVVNLDLETLSLRKELTKTEKQSVEEEKARLAEQFLGKARDYWKTGDYFNCIRYCEFASNYSDKNAAVFSLLGQALCRNPDYRWQKRAENALLRAAELEPFSPVHFVALGDFYRGHGLFGKARKHYEKAVQILPSHVQALQALKELPQSKD
jgi:tetratricopeptide (TPR) repeat protein